MEGTVTISLRCFNQLKVTRKELEDEYLIEHQQEIIDRLTYWDGLKEGQQEGKEAAAMEFENKSLLQKFVYSLWGV